MEENISESNLKQLKHQAIGKFLFLFFFIGVLFFSTAGTIFYWEAWLFLINFITQMIFIIRYLLKHDPLLLQRRLEKSENISNQKQIVGLSSLVFLIIFIIPGFDKQFGWSNLHLLIIFMGNIIFIIGYQLFFRVLKENSYASRIVNVEKETQNVISTGPYGLVRHPMYLAILIMFGGIPIALGSFFAFIPIFLLFIMLPLRVKGEEKLLKEELEGYSEYTKKVKYRIFPGIW